MGNFYSVLFTIAVAITAITIIAYRAAIPEEDLYEDDGK